MEHKRIPPEEFTIVIKNPDRKTSDARKRANVKWDKANMTVLSAHVTKEYAAAVKEKAALEGVSVHSIIKAALDEYLSKTVG